VKKGEMVLNTISDRKESSHYLGELITIINNAALSMGEVRNGIDDTIVVAWFLLS
jgi:ArsR family metal-binding transcriptional regulator